MVGPPKPIGTPPRSVSIAGHVIPYWNDQPVLVEISGTSDAFLPVFSTIEKLEEAMMEIHAAFDSIKQIDDPTRFLSELPINVPLGRLRVIIDLYGTDDGRVRFTEVVRGH